MYKEVWCVSVKKDISYILSKNNAKIVVLFLVFLFTEDIKNLLQIRETSLILSTLKKIGKKWIDKNAQEN